MKRTTIIFSLVALTVCGCHDAKEEKQPSQQGNLPEGVVATTATVEEQALCETLTLSGRVACDERLLRKLYIPCTGKIGGISVETGDKVRRGQVLATVSSQDAATHEKELRDAESGLRVAERELRTAEDLYASQMLSERELAAAREEVVRLRAEWERLQQVAGINGYQGGSTATITSPIDGYVTAKSVYNSCYVDETNNDTPAFEIADLSRVWVVADVYENDLARLREGAAATVTTLAWKDETFHGRIDKVYNVIDSESKTMKVRIALPNPDGKLVPGIFASVCVSIPSSQPTALTVPAQSIIFDGGRHYVVVQRGPSLEHREIDVLQTTDTLAWVCGDLRPGEEVVCKNALLVFNQTK